MTSLQRQAIERIEQVYANAEKIYNRKFPFPEINFEVRGTRGGYAIFLKNLIAINNVLLHQHGEEFVRDVPGHEAAHLLARHLYGNFIASHGVEWRRVMTLVCNQPANRCHTFEVKTDHVYYCHCRKHYLSTKRHNLYLSGKNAYSCKDCKSLLYWEKVYEKTPQFA
jgi:SprT protein